MSRIEIHRCHRCHRTMVRNEQDHWVCQDCEAENAEMLATALQQQAEPKKAVHNKLRYIKGVTSTYPKTLTLIPLDDYDQSPIKPNRAWLSQKWLVQEWKEDNPTYPYMIRLSICSTKRTPKGWDDGITWDELQKIKREVGYGDWYAIEVYPMDKDIVNVANFRHLWVMPVSLTIGWKSKHE